MIYFHADSAYSFFSQGILSLRWKMKIKLRECTR